MKKTEPGFFKFIGKSYKFKNMDYNKSEVKLNYMDDVN